MEYDFFLPKNILPNGFKYPDDYVRFVNANLIPDLEPWHFYYLDGGLEFAFNGLKERYPKRIIVPFARRRDNDDVACFDASEPSKNPKILIIHDWASPGWENRGGCDTFLVWVELAKEESNEWKNYWRDR